MSPFHLQYTQKQFDPKRAPHGLPPLWICSYPKLVHPIQTQTDRVQSDADAPQVFVLEQQGMQLRQEGVEAGGEDDVFLWA